MYIISAELVKKCVSTAAAWGTSNNLSRAVLLLFGRRPSARGKISQDCRRSSLTGTVRGGRTWPAARRVVNGEGRCRLGPRTDFRNFRYAPWRFLDRRHTAYRTFPIRWSDRLSGSLLDKYSCYSKYPVVVGTLHDGHLPYFYHLLLFHFTIYRWNRFISVLRLGNTYYCVFRISDDNFNRPKSVSDDVFQLVVSIYSLPIGKTLVPSWTVAVKVWGGPPLVAYLNNAIEEDLGWPSSEPVYAT